MAKKPKEEFDRHGYSLSPQNVNKGFWYYEEAKGLCCIYQARDAASGKLVWAPPAFHIPWKVFDRTMKRRQAYLKRRARR